MGPCRRGVALDGTSGTTRRWSGTWWEGARDPAGGAWPSTRHWGHLTSVVNLVRGCLGPWRRGVALRWGIGTLDEGRKPGGRGARDPAGGAWPSTRHKGHLTSVWKPGGRVSGTLEEGRGLPLGIGDT